MDREMRRETGKTGRGRREGNDDVVVMGRGGRLVLNGSCLSMEKNRGRKTSEKQVREQGVE